jgi:hypothetical protein
LLQPVQRGSRIRKLADAVVELALASPDAAEVEAQRREAALGEQVVQHVHDVVVHRAGMRVQDDRDGRARARPRLIAAFEAALGAGENDFWHCAPIYGESPILQPERDPIR